jgi:hypothetical protein
MNGEEFIMLSTQLRKDCTSVPTEWPDIQNDVSDNKLSFNIFTVSKLSDLNNLISDFEEPLQLYYRRRWFLAKCAECDEYLFYQNSGVIKNPQSESKEWDIRIDRTFSLNKQTFLCTYYFDLKSTDIPKKFEGGYDAAISAPPKLIQFYYNEQSKGVRFDMQNRLFIVHHSLVSAQRTSALRCAWKTKEACIKKFLSNINDIVFYSYRGCTTGIIFVIDEGSDTPKIIIPGLVK